MSLVRSQPREPIFSVGYNDILVRQRSVDREFLTSSDFWSGLNATGRGYLVSTGRFALRGIGRAQELYTLDPDIASDEVMAGKYERYLAS